MPKKKSLQKAAAQAVQSSAFATALSSCSKLAPTSSGSLWRAYSHHPPQTVLFSFAEWRIRSHRKVPSPLVIHVLLLVGGRVFGLIGVFDSLQGGEQVHLPYLLNGFWIGKSHKKIQPLHIVVNQPPAWGSWLCKGNCTLFRYTDTNSVCAVYVISHFCQDIAGFLASI